MKAQLEFIFILALVLTAVVVIVLVSQQSMVEKEKPQVIGFSEEKKLIKNSIENAILTIAKKNLESIYSSGGYADGSEAVDYGLSKVMVWEKCGKIKMPNIAFRLSSMIKNDIKALFRSQMDFYGKKVEINLNRLDISVNILKNVVKVDVDMPTEVDGSKIPMPYSVSIPSELYAILKLSENLLEQGKERVFEMNTLDSIYRSSPASDYWLPTFGLLTGCDKILFIDKAKALQSLKKTIIYTISHTVAGRNLTNQSSELFYKLNLSDTEFSIAFVYPDEWKLYENFDMSPNPAFYMPQNLITLTSTCISSYNISYSFRYPLIAQIKDDVFREWFRFAVMVSIKNNRPDADCEVAETSSHQRLCSDESGCFSRIWVRDLNGLPVENADVIFDDCFLGKTNREGFVQGALPCMLGEFSVYKHGYKPYTQFLKSGDLEHFEITLKPSIKTKIHFYGVPVRGIDKKTEGMYEKYEVSGQPKMMDEFLKKYIVIILMMPQTHLPFENLVLFNVRETGLSSEAEVEDLPQTLFKVVGVVFENETMDVVGLLNTSFASSGTEKELNIYMPLVMDNYPANEKPVKIDLSEIKKLTDALTSCGITPISRERQNCW
ncbi:MAG: hypothetical protein J7K72_02790 [Candidatus Aenigmarchaeota archaeon]|nr:hypothetical protein [Candidatus Aenigmarchaeota archaeon]